MKFSGKLDDKNSQRVEACDLLLTSPARLEALAETGLMDTASEEAYDRLARLAARILKVPLTIVSLVSDTKQFFKASYGMPAPLDVTREIPIDGSICRYTLQGEPIIVADASQDQFLKYHPATDPWGIVAFIAIPMMTDSGHVLGAFCAVDTVLHPWSEEEILVLRELTSSVMTEIKLRTEVLELKKERELRERFVETLTHDLRTPLTAARMSAQLTQKKIEDVAAVSALSKRIISNIDRADRMIRDLLDTNLIKAGKGIPLMISETYLDLLIQTVLADLDAVYGPRFKVIDELGHCRGFWDAIGIQRVLENLVGNAVKYGEKGSTIEILLRKKNEQIEIVVHNSGNPIAAEDLKTLFEPYKRTHSARSGGQKGWGIGLSLVKAIAEAHGGSVGVESSLEYGTTFHVLLPLDARGRDY